MYTTFNILCIQGLLRLTLNYLITQIFICYIIIAVYKKPRLEDNPPAPWEEEEEREASETQEPRDPGKKQ